MKPIVELLKDFFIQRFILYGVITFFSFFVIVPLGDLRIRFTDDHCSRCILYSDVDYNVTPSAQAHYFRIQFGEQEVCEYSIAVSSVFCLLYPLAVGAIYLYLYKKDSQEASEEKKLDLANFIFLIHIGVEVVVVVLILVSACMISAGFRHLCKSLIRGSNGTHAIINSCIEAQDFASWRGYDGSNFYVSLSVATAGAWFLFLSWALQGALGVWKVWRLNMLPVLPFSLPCLRSRAE